MMTKFPAGYEISDKIAIDHSAFKRLKAYAFAPQEEVRLNPAFAKEEVEGLFAFSASRGHMMVVEKVIYDGHNIKYKLDGFEPVINGGLISDAREISHHYGVIVVSGGDLWGVALHDEDETVLGCYMIKGEPERHVAWNQGTSTREELIDYIREGVVGEFVLADNGEKGVSLVSMPWSADAKDQEITLAKEAIELQKAPSLNPM